MSFWNPISYLNRILYGSYAAHDDFDLKPSLLPMTEQDATYLRTNIPSFSLGTLRLKERVQEVSNNHKVDLFFLVKKIERGQFEELQGYWKKVAWVSPWAAGTFMIIIMGGAKVCMSGHNPFLKIVGYVIVIAASVFAAKCIEDASSSRTNNEILKDIKKFQNYGELFARRRSQLFPQSIQEVLEHENLRLDADPQWGILHPIEVHSLYKSNFWDWCNDIAEQEALLETAQRKEQWVESCIRGLDYFFREDLIGNIFRDNPKEQGSLLGARKKLLEMGSKLKQQLVYIRIPENKIQWITSCIQRLDSLFKKTVIGNFFRYDPQKQDELIEARKKLLDVSKKLKDLLSYIQNAEKKIQAPLQELTTRMKPLLAKVQELQKKTYLDEFFENYVKDEIIDWKNQELQDQSDDQREAIEDRWAKKEQEISHYRDLILEAITMEQWGEQLKVYLEASHRSAHYYLEVKHLYEYAQAIIRGHDFTYQLSKKEVTLAVPSLLDPNTLELRMTENTRNTARDRVRFLQMGNSKDYLLFLRAYGLFLIQKNQASSQNP